MPDDTPEELEAERLKAIRQLDLDTPDWREDFSPGTHGCHEALHVASIYTDNIFRDLAGHPAIVADPKWYSLAMKAGNALFDLYQAIGAVHLGKRATTAPPSRSR